MHFEIREWESLDFTPYFHDWDPLKFHMNILLGFCIFFYFFNKIGILVIFTEPVVTLSSIVISGYIPLFVSKLFIVFCVRIFHFFG
jgi:hypothetical protein